jgi:hypothetical protein
MWKKCGNKDVYALVGAEGKEKNVWLGWFLCDVLQGLPANTGSSS